MSETTATGNRKQRRGTVVSISGAKSVVVEVEVHKRHPVYGKTLRHRRRFHAHDEKSAAKVGDKVCIEECRPYSKLKRWRVVAEAPAADKA
jgi:small subunit ribosomal protein S17